jgi:transposase
MRQSHPAGERLFVDYAGQTVDVIDPLTGEVRAAHIFVAALGASNLTYAEAWWSEGLADWLGCHVNAFAFFGGVPRQLVCDNLKAGVITSSRYEPGINRSYQDLATHYGTAVVPTRVRKPRDKAKVEVAVQVVQRWVLPRLRHRQFFSLVTLNAAIRKLTDQLNDRPMRHLGVSRRALFDSGERDALRELPSEPYVYAEWRRCRAGIDYHVEVHGHWYSVPSRLVREPIEARISEQTVELFHRGVRIASHIRSPLRGPSHHNRRAYAKRAPTLCTLDARAPTTRSGGDRSINCCPDRAHPERQATP